jgi:hypothetical protein
MTKNLRRVGLVVGAIPLVVGACSAPPLPSARPPSPSPGATPVAVATTPAASSTDVIGSVAPPTPVALSDAPVAVLVVGAERYPGVVGGFTFGRYSQSAPWLPAPALHTVEVRAGAELRVELDDRATVDDWVARVATVADRTADNITGLAQGIGPVIAFAAPASGNWVVSVTITYGGGLGSGAYYWHLMVD